MTTSRNHGRTTLPQNINENIALVNVNLKCGNDSIPLTEVEEELRIANNGEELPQDMQRRLVQMTDQNYDGPLTHQESHTLMTTGASGRHHQAVPLTTFQKVIRLAISTVVPPGSKTKRQTYGDEIDGATAEETDLVEDYIEHYDCHPPPLFMLIISLVELAVFIGYAVHQQNTYGIPTTMLSGAPRYSPLIYIPARRYEAWRFASYMFIHSGIKHLISNLILQLVIGIPLEMVHKWWRVGIVYTLGVIAGSLATSVVDPWIWLCGASGGCYALIGAHFAVIIMNWKDMTHDWMSGPVKFLLSAPVLLAFWTIYACVDTGVAIYSRSMSDTAYAAHFAGAVVGVLVGIPVLKNFKVLPWERVVFWVALSLYIALTIFTILFNVFYTRDQYYPPTDWTPCCSYYKPIGANPQ